jgi:FHS family L-fucose permease-like MFS transporter
MWGFITAMNDILIPHLKGLFELSYTQAMLVQSCFFGAYFLVSIPGGKLVSNVGYQKGIGIGLITAAVGCLLFIPSALFAQYWMFLGALFILAAGITILQVAANPLVTMMGPVTTASSRLTMTQAFNSLGTTVAPIIGGLLIFSAHASAKAEANSVILPYVGLATILVLMAISMLKVSLPSAHNSQQEINTGSLSKGIFHHRHLILGALGIFTYVGAEVSIGSFLVNYFSSAHVLSMTEAQAAKYLAYYWGGAMVGRFLGAWLMQHVRPGLLLAVNSSLSVGLILLSINSGGHLALWSMLAVGLCNSIMFPTIFSLALKDLGPQTAQGSGLLCLAIVGGAVVPLIQGLIADNMGLTLSFLLPVICYLYIGYFGLSGSKPVVSEEN